MVAFYNMDIVLGRFSEYITDRYLYFRLCEKKNANWIETKKPDKQVTIIGSKILAINIVRIQSRAPGLQRKS